MRIKVSRDTFAPWAGVFLGAGAWAFHHQAGSNAIYWDCRLGGPLLTGGLGLLCALVTIAGGLISWRARRTPADTEGGPQNRDVSGFVGAACAAIFLLVIAFQSLSGFILPACLR